MHGQGGEGEIILAANVFAQVCAQNHSCAQFIVPKRGLILSTSMALVPVGGPESKLHSSCRSTTLQPQFQSVRLTSRLCVKWVPQVFPAMS